jgi:hypothetical protein
MHEITFSSDDKPKLLSQVCKFRYIQSVVFFSIYTSMIFHFLIFLLFISIDYVAFYVLVFKLFMDDLELKYGMVTIENVHN